MLVSLIVANPSRANPIKAKRVNHFRDVNMESMYVYITFSWSQAHHGPMPLPVALCVFC